MLALPLWHHQHVKDPGCKQRVRSALYWTACWILIGVNLLRWSPDFFSCIFYLLSLITDLIFGFTLKVCLVRWLNDNKVRVMGGKKVLEEVSAGPNNTTMRMYLLLFLLQFFPDFLKWPRRRRPEDVSSRQRGALTFTPSSSICAEASSPALSPASGCRPR